MASPARRGTLNLAVAAMVNQIMLIVSGSLSARILGPADRGNAALLVLVPSVLCVAGSMGLVPAVVHFVAKAPRATANVLGALRRQLALQLATLTVIHIVITLAWLQPRLHHGGAAAFIAVAGVPAGVVTQYALAVLQGHQRFLAFSAIVVVGPCLFGLEIAILYASGTGDLVLVVLANMIATLVGAVAALAMVRRHLRSSDRAADAARTTELRSYGRRSYFGQIAPVEAFRLDQLAIGATLTPAVLGYYTAATALTNFSRFMGDSIGHVLAPYIASLPADRRTRSLIRGIGVAAAICGLVTACLFPAVGFLVPWLFGAGFRPAVPLAKILLIAGFLLGVRRALLFGARGLGRPGVGSVAELAALLVFLVLLPVALQDDTGKGIAILFVVSAIVGMVAIIALLVGVPSRRRDEGASR